MGDGAADFRPGGRVRNGGTLALVVSAPLSVVMPAGNAESWVEQAVRSILAQTFGDFELIVLDDASEGWHPHDASERGGRGPAHPPVQEGHAARPSR